MLPTKVKYIPQSAKRASEARRCFTPSEVEQVIQMALEAGREGYTSFVLHPVRNESEYYVQFRKEPSATDKSNGA